MKRFSKEWWIKSPKNKIREVQLLFPNSFLMGIKAYSRVFRNNLFGISKNESVEIISIHLPKTAGTSFLKSLKDNYGPRLLTTYNLPDIGIAYSQGSYSKIPFSKTVLHGHFPGYTKLKYYYPNAKIITWIRNPIDRVLSHYNYFKLVKNPSDPANILLMKENLSLLDFVKHPKCRHHVFVYQSFFKEIDFHDFYFIGLLENYCSHLKKLGEMLEWRFIEEVSLNVSTVNLKIDEPTLKELKMILVDEIQVYDEWKLKIIGKIGD